MKRIITFLIIICACNAISNAQNYIVYEVANTVRLADGKDMHPISRGQKLNVKSKLDFAAKATLDIINIETNKRYILNANKGFYSLEKLIGMSNGIELSMDYVRYLMKRLLEKTAASGGDGYKVGGISRDMFDIQEWLDNDSIDNMNTTNESVIQQ